jgi:hypothetical protein
MLRGKAHPNQKTKLRLFTDSGGFCQNQECNLNLFPLEEERGVHIAEMAHIFAAMDKGPRPNPELTEEERGNYENIILLCANCHTKVDKAPEVYTDQVVASWKLTHAEKLAATFGITHFQSRGELKKEIGRLLAENKAVHDSFGPDLGYRSNPEAPEAAVWQQRVRTTIIPNSNLIIRQLDANVELLSPDEMETVSEFKVHVKGLVLRHILGDSEINIRFPTKITEVAS